MVVQKSCKLEVNRLRNKNFNSVELYWGLGPENAIFNIIEYFKLVKNRKSSALIFNLTPPNTSHSYVLSTH